MPRYFFNVDGAADGSDLEGTVLNDVAEARRQAVLAAGAMFSEHGNTMCNGESWSMKISDETGTTLFTIRFNID